MIADVQTQEDDTMTRSSDPSDPRFRLMRLRHAAQLDQAAFGARIGVAESTVSRWENGVRIPARGLALDVLLKLRDFPRVDLAELRALATGWGVDPDDVGIPEPPDDEVDDEAPRAAATAAVAGLQHAPVDARRVVDAALLAAAEDSDLPVRVVRRVMATMLATFEAGGVSVGAARAAIVKA
jgi:DNA-binding transcriptional regulator YiaG